ncbi:hypothetical protein D3C80_982450 [compost metagenome]
MHLVVASQLDPILLQRLAQLGVDLARCHEQRGLILADQCERNKHRIVGNVTATQVEQPGNVVERGKKVPVGATLLEALAQFGKLVTTTERRMGWQMLVDGIGRQGWAIFPDACQQVGVRAQANVPRLELVPQLACRRHRHHRTVHRHHAALRRMLGQPFKRARISRLQFHQHNRAACQLPVGLFPITAIGPQPGEVLGNDQGADLPVETRQPLPPLPVARQVLGEMRVGRRDQQGGDAFALHHFAYTRQPGAGCSLG